MGAFKLLSLLLLTGCAISYREGFFPWSSYGTTHNDHYYLTGEANFVGFSNGFGVNNGEYSPWRCGGGCGGMGGGLGYYDNYYGYTDSLGSNYNIGGNTYVSAPHTYYYSS